MKAIKNTFLTCVCFYLQCSNWTVGGQVEVLGQVVIAKKHGQMSSTQIHVLYTLQDRERKREMKQGCVRL